MQGWIEIAMIRALVCPLKVQTVELIGTALQELLGRQMLQRMDDDVVGFDRVWYRRDGAMRRCDILGEIVDHPISHVFDAVEAQEIEGFIRLRQTRTFPRSRRLAAEFCDGVDGALDRIGLVGELMHRALHEPVTHELKAGLQRG